MTNFLRNTSSRVLAVLAAASLGLLVGGAVIANGTASSGTKPVAKPLAQAIAGSFAGSEEFTGVSARVEFTNKLLDSSGIAGNADPLAGGGNGRLWADPEGRVRIELQSNGGGGDVQLVSDGKVAWLVHGASGEAWKATIPEYPAESDGNKPAGSEWPPSAKSVAQAIRALSPDAKISAAQPDNVGGRPAYTVRVIPRDRSGLLAGGIVSWDAATGAPLAVSVLAKGQAEPVLSVKATSLEFGPVDGSVFEVDPPANAKEVDLTALKSEAAAKAEKSRNAPAKKSVTGLRSVQAKLPFRISAPKAIGGRKLEVVALMGEGDDAAAVLTYGNGIGAIAVVQSAAKPEPKETGSGWDDDGSFALPTVRVRGAEATKLQTALGSVVTFTRKGVSFTVMGSLPGDRVVAAARQLP